MKSVDSPQEFEGLVEKQLRSANLRYEKQVVIGTTRPDFLVMTEGGHRLVVEAKNWIVNSDAELERAVHQAHTYKRLSNADEAIIVIAGGRSSDRSGPVVTPISNLP